MQCSALPSVGFTAVEAKAVAEADPKAVAAESFRKLRLEVISFRSGKGIPGS